MIFHSEICGSCGACVGVCPQGSLELTENVAILDETKCDDCGKCVLICPLGAFKGAKI